jgi:tetratricopeptide (TPR) repeat protein
VLPGSEQFGAVVAAARQLAAELPDYDEAHYQLGFALAALGGDWRAAVEVYRDVLRLNPDHENAKIALKSEDMLDREAREGDALARREQHLATVRAVLAGRGLEFEPGSGVVIVGVKSQPELNGRAGTVLAYVVRSGRFSVAVDGVEQPKKLRLANLKARSQRPANVCDAGHALVFHVGPNICRAYTLD